MATLELPAQVPAAPAPPWGEAARVFLFKSLFTNLCGVTVRDWAQIVRTHGLAIEPRYWHRAALVSAASVLNSWYKWREDRAFGARLAATAVQPPLFILGHWRSGTTLLHNLLALDDRFAYPNLYEVFFPHTFLGTEDHRTGLAAPLIPQTRVFDNVAQRLDMPNEDEFATAAASLCSPYMLWAFPRAWQRYEPYLTFRGVPERERERWESALLDFMKKLTLRYGRPLLLKSPPHTGRLRLLARLFPEAKFVHVHRDPYTVYQSTCHMNRIFTGCLQFQKSNPEDLDAGVMRRYRLMHDAYFDERDSLPDSQLHELAFEDLELDPVGQVRQIYDRLGLPGFDDVLPRIEDHLAGLASYRKNAYAPLEPAVKRRVRGEWARSFETWSYPD